MPHGQKESTVQLAMVGLGRMGMNMARRLLQGGHQVVAYNRTPERSEEIAREGAVACHTLQEATGKLAPPRIVWLMLPAGEVTEQHLQKLMEMLSPGDIIIDGGNGHYRDDGRRASTLAGRGIRYLDVGVSGGIRGLEAGYCLMVGGAEDAFTLLAPIWQSLAPPAGYLHCGPTGAGHFVKMIHNGIEYGLMQAYAEGFALLDSSDYATGFDYGRIAHLWNQGSIIRSWLLELLEQAFSKDQRLQGISGHVEDSGEGRWTVQQAVESGTPAPVISQALFRRFASREQDAFADRILAALRREFGGHAVRDAD
jgi:6-phosphogluconate dehydrogenase